MTGRSRPVSSRQSGPHKDLKRILEKHLARPCKKPQRAFSGAIFDRIDQIQNTLNRPVLLDSGCGNGESSLYLAKKYPRRLIIGLDKSKKRLHGRLGDQSIYFADNLILARADVVDIWRLATSRRWPIKKHCLFYPNPWPKPRHLKRRWHAHPVFPQMPGLNTQIELRTNWRIYAEEFKQALHIALHKKAAIEVIRPAEFISLFERKYHASGHELYRVRLR